MKIRTREEFFEKISEDISWRKKELSFFKARIDTASQKTIRSEVRVGIVMLYSHWEGFIRNAANYYLLYVKQKKLPYSKLSRCLLTLALKTKLVTTVSTNEHKEQQRFIDFFLDDLNTRAYWNLEKAIDTKSNLNSEVLLNILSVIGIDPRDFQLKSNLIDKQLVKNRNTISHGNYFHMEKDDYSDLHDQIVGMMNNLSNRITNSVVLEKYKKH